MLTVQTPCYRPANRQRQSKAVRDFHLTCWRTEQSTQTE